MPIDVPDIDNFVAAAELAMIETGSRQIVTIAKMQVGYVAIFATPPVGFIRPFYAVAPELADFWVEQKKERIKK